eukprot:135108-Rhodomonas_salina.1
MERGRERGVDHRVVVWACPHRGPASAAPRRAWAAAEDALRLLRPRTCTGMSRDTCTVMSRGTFIVMGRGSASREEL